MAEEPGTLIDHYRLIAAIGSGGFSTVYQAVDERLEADVAIKVLAENHALDAEVRERFVAEAQLLRRIECPAVVAVHDVGETSRSQPYIVMAYADRGDLGTRAHRLWSRPGHNVTHGEALTVARTLASGLGRAHRAGLVHRDVKPGNLLLATEPGSARANPPHPQSLIEHDERILLSDMGFGKDLLASSGLTVGGGTYGFAAPEQRAAQGTVDARADIHAASALLYWLFTQRTPPDDGADIHLSSHLPTELVPVLRQGLAVDPDRRFATIDEWFAQVGAALAPRTVATPQALGTASVTPRRPTPDGSTSGAGPGAVGDKPVPRIPPPATAGRRRRWLVPLILLAGLLAGAAATVAFSRSTGGPTVTVDVDGVQTVALDQDALSLTVVGPARVGVGDPIQLEATTNGVTDVRWFAPAGGVGVGETLVLKASRTGVATISAVAADAFGRTITVEFEVTVDDDA